VIIYVHRTLMLNTAIEIWWFMMGASCDGKLPVGTFKLYQVAWTSKKLFQVVRQCFWRLRHIQFRDGTNPRNILDHLQKVVLNIQWNVVEIHRQGLTAVVKTNIARPSSATESSLFLLGYQPKFCRIEPTGFSIKTSNLTQPACALGKTFNLMGYIQYWYLIIL